MSVENLSFTVRCRHDSTTNTTRLQIVRVDTVDEVHLNNSKFLVRVMIDGRGLVERYLIRHIASGREAYVQGGLGLSTLVRECLLDSDRSGEHR